MPRVADELHSKASANPECNGVRTIGSNILCTHELIEGVLISICFCPSGKIKKGGRASGPINQVMSIQEESLFCCSIHSVEWYFCRNLYSPMFMKITKEPKLPCSPKPFDGVVVELQYCSSSWSVFFLHKHMYKMQAI